MDQTTQNLTMKERLLDQSNKSDTPTITYVTTKAILFFISAVATIASLFGNWFALDIDLGYFSLDDVLGTVNVFRMPAAINEIEESFGMFGVFLPEDIKSGLAMVKFACYALMILAIAAIALYVYAAILRIKRDDNTAKFGRIAAGCAVLTVVGFVLMVGVLLNSLEAMNLFGSAIGKILSGPCLVTLVGAIVSAICAVMDIGFKEDVVIYHNGVLKIDRGPKWRCSCCHRRNLSLLEKCFYCGTNK